MSNKYGNRSGKSGPPKKPTKLKLLHGTFRADTVPAKEPDPEPDLLPAPDHLSAEAKLEWAYISEELFTLGLLSRCDRTALGLYCEAFADWKESKALCQTAGGNDRKVLKGPDGKFYKNPYYVIKLECAAACHRYLTEFGMTPASRSRINTLVDAPLSAQKTNDKNYA